jgi:hypothetical protein
MLHWTELIIFYAIASVTDQDEPKSNLQSFSVLKRVVHIATMCL